MTIDENIPLKHLTTFKVGGNARYFCVAKSVNDLEEAMIFSKRAGVPFFILGGGSNVLISDEGFHGLVIKIAFKGLSFEDHKTHIKAHVAAGEHWDNFVEEAVREGFWGIENLSGIPGTAGASPVQNIGAYGAEISSCVETVDIFDAESSSVRKLSADQCRFGYRESLFKRPEGKNFIITSVTYRLLKDGKPNISYRDLDRHFGESGVSKPGLREIRQAILKIRRDKFPSLEEFGTAGSFFKNPIIGEKEFELVRKNFPNIPSFPAGRGLVKISLAWILDKALGFKGKKMGHVGLYDKQPLVLINFGEATAHEILVFADKVAHDVKEKIGLNIEREVRSIGEELPPSRYQNWFWSVIYTILPKFTAFIQAVGIHRFRQSFVIGHLREDKTPEDFSKHLRSKGYSKAFMAWIDPGEVLSLRKIVHKKFQYHIRLFRDGEIRGHYEYTPEGNPIGHLYETIFQNPKDYFHHLLHVFLKK